VSLHLTAPLVTENALAAPAAAAKETTVTETEMIKTGIGTGKGGEEAGALTGEEARLQRGEGMTEREPRLRRLTLKKMISTGLKPRRTE